VGGSSKLHVRSSSPRASAARRSAVSVQPSIFDPRRPRRWPQRPHGRQDLRPQARLRRPSASLGIHVRPVRVLLLRLRPASLHGLPDIVVILIGAPVPVIRGLRPSGACGEQSKRADADDTDRPAVSSHPSIQRLVQARVKPMRTSVTPERVAWKAVSLFGNVFDGLDFLQPQRRLADHFD
jgi:hypothetical protein